MVSNGVQLNKVPENVGEYTVKLNNKIISALNSQNDNYNFKFDNNSLDYTISPATATVKLVGYDTQQQGNQFDLNKYAIQIGSEMRKLSDLN